MKALVTGATGFLGHHLANALTDSGYEVRCLDVNPPAYGLLDGQTYIGADVRDRASTMRAEKPREGGPMDAATAIYSCDDHLDLRAVPRELWRSRLPRADAERAPHVVERDGDAVWVCEDRVLGRRLYGHLVNVRVGHFERGERGECRSARNGERTRRASGPHAVRAC